MGHTGTLDPLASGVLVLCVGMATRLAEYVQRMDKTYRTDIRLGARSDTDDDEGTVVPVAVEAPPQQALVTRALDELAGEIDQTPPNYSAAKVAGRRAYDLARGGKAVSLQPRRVHVYRIDLNAYDFPRLDLTIHCSKGTYIRSLARDLGERLGCGALVETLRRLRVGRFSVGDAVGLDVDSATARSRLLPVEAAVSDLPSAQLQRGEIARLRHGQAVSHSDIAFWDQLPSRGGDVAIFDESHSFVGLAKAEREERKLYPEKMLTLASGAC
jgi:tRNA pseudouridine55 synthase